MKNKRNLIVLAVVAVISAILVLHNVLSNED